MALVNPPAGTASGPSWALALGVQKQIAKPTSPRDIISLNMLFLSFNISLSLIVSPTAGSGGYKVLEYN